MSPSPIRSNRGRSAVWRSLWAWPLHSRTRALITLVVVVLALVLVGQIVSVGRGNQTAPPAPPRPVPAPKAPSAPPPPSAPAPEPGPITAAGPPAPQEALRDAQGFMTGWVAHATAPTPGSWVAGMAPYTSPEYVGQLATIDPANVTAARLVGDPTVTRVDDAVVELVWPTDSGLIHLTLIHPTGPWQVNAVSGEGP